jgi:hypothetical protein
MIYFILFYFSESLSEAKSRSLFPESMSDIKIDGTISIDNMGPLFLGTFSSSSGRKEKHSSLPNLCIRSFVLSEIDKHSLKDSMLRYIDAAKTITAAASYHSLSPAVLALTESNATPGSTDRDSQNSNISNLEGNRVAMSNILLPNYVSIIRQPNALHLVFNSPIVADLSSLIRSMVETTTTIGISLDVISYTMACLVSALETMHEAMIIYRAVQPESIYVDASGRLVLMDYRVCKVGITKGERTFTVCGAADYLSPEQVELLLIFRHFTF